jgi:hypothetical protein
MFLLFSKRVFISSGTLPAPD